MEDRMRYFDLGWKIMLRMCRGVRIRNAREELESYQRLMDSLKELVEKREEILVKEPIVK